MTTLKNFLKNFLKNKSGATAVEYGLIVAGVGVVMSLALNPLGDAITETLNDATLELGGTPPIPGTGTG